MYVMINAGAVRVPQGAGFDPGLEITVTPQLTQFQNAITTHQAGYVYVWVSNESENSKVWFDDLKVTHRSSRVTQATDFYAWGNVMRENKSPEDVRYRYGYQGQFAEKDEETGWNHFELREYDPVVARWTAVDPKRQYYSPYVGMGNNPVNAVDPDGGKNVKFDASGNYVGIDHDVWWHNLLFGSRGVVVGANGDFTSTFKFADPKNDVADLESGVINRIVFTQESEIVQMLGNAGAFENKSFSEAIDYLKAEGVGGGKFDFSYTAIPDMYSGASRDPLRSPSPMLFIVDGVAHNHMNFGNFLFGAGGGALLGDKFGFSGLVLRAGAHYNSVRNAPLNGYPSQLDSGDDQFSIFMGYRHSYQRNYNGMNYSGGRLTPRGR